MSREIDRENMSPEDALYLSQRGLLSAAEEEQYGIKPSPLGGNATFDLGPNTGDVGTSDGAPLVGGSGAPSPSAIAEAYQSESDATFTEPEPEGEGEGDEGYASWSKEELVAEAESRELAKSGTKDELIARLEANDAEGE